MGLTCTQCGVGLGGRGAVPKFCPQCGTAVPRGVDAPRAAAVPRGAEAAGLLCPHCRTTNLRIADRAGIEIDYCPACRGVWLERGELDKIIERSARADEDWDARRAAGPDDDDDRRGGRRYGKRKSFLGDMFDIFD